MALALFTEKTVADPSVMNKMVVDINKNTSEMQKFATTKSITNFNLAVTNGKYSAFDSPNAPTGGSTFNLDVTTDDSGIMVSQTAMCVFGLKVGTQYTRFKNNAGTWSTWKEVATTEKIPILASPQPGKTIIRQNSFKINNIYYIDLDVKLTTGIFTAGIQYDLVAFNVINKISTPKNVSCTSWSDSFMHGSGGIGTLFTSKTLYAHPTFNCDFISVSGTFVEEG